MADKLAKSDEYIQAEVVTPREAAIRLLTTGEGAFMHRAEQAREADRQDLLHRTAYPMRGRFHCCDPKTVQTYHVDTGEARVDAVCELCGWSFQSQAYAHGPSELPDLTTPPPLAADCNEPTRTPYAQHVRGTVDALIHRVRKLANPDRHDD